jgi:hypothetical protein
MENTSKQDKALSRRDLAYYRRRQQNRVFAKLAAFFANEAEHGRITRKEIAEKLSKDPAQITRWLSTPSNLTLDTISDLLLAMNAEVDHQIVRFADRPKPNYAHPMIAPYVGLQNSKTKKIAQTPTTAKPLSFVAVKIKDGRGVAANSSIVASSMISADP